MLSRVIDLSYLQYIWNTITKKSIIIIIIVIISLFVTSFMNLSFHV